MIYGVSLKKIKCRMTGFTDYSSLSIFWLKQSFLFGLASFFIGNVVGIFLLFLCRTEMDILIVGGFIAFSFFLVATSVWIFCFSVSMILGNIIRFAFCDGKPDSNYRKFHQFRQRQKWLMAINIDGLNGIAGIHGIQQQNLKDKVNK